MASKVKKVSNWASLAAKIGSDPSNAAKKRKRQEVEEKEQESKHQSKTSKTKGSLPENVPEHVKSKYIGLDCEMVGIGLTGKQSALARCCCVNFDGEVIYDKFVRPQSFVTDFRTQWSGVRKRDLRQGEAIPLAECQQDVANLLQDKILVGHALKNDLSVLMLSHRKNMIRDTASWKPYMRVSVIQLYHFSFQIIVYVANFSLPHCFNRRTARHPGIPFIFLFSRVHNNNPPTPFPPS